MLLNITVENFRSYNEAQTLSLIASENNGVNSVAVGKFEIRKSAIIYGANASGKSNLIEVCLALVSILYHDINQPNQFALNSVYHPFFKNNKPTSISIDFMVKEDIYTYSISYDNEKIYFEELLDEDDRQIFSRYLADDKYNYYVPRPELILSDEQLEFSDSLLRQIQASTSEKRPFLRQLVDNNCKKLEPILLKFRNNLVVRLNPYGFVAKRFNPYGFIGKPLLAEQDLNYAINYFEQMNMNNDIVKSLNNIGATFKNLLVKNDILGGNVKKIISQYIVNGKECELDFVDDESDGTVKFYSYLALVDFIIQNDGVLIIDELETHFHPLLVEEIIKAIHRSKSKAQLIFTTHNPILLNESIFEHDQIYFA